MASILTARQMPKQVFRAEASNMSHTSYAGDPRQITAKFSSECHTCGKKIQKGEQIIYWPNGKKAGHLKCDEADYHQSLASFEDEDRYHGR
jgi:hypothetical protein